MKECGQCRRQTYLDDMVKLAEDVYLCMTCNAKALAGPVQVSPDLRSLINRALDEAGL